MDGTSNLEACLGASTKDEKTEGRYSVGEFSLRQGGEDSQGTT